MQRSIFLKQLFIAFAGSLAQSDSLVFSKGKTTHHEATMRELLTAQGLYFDGEIDCPTRSLEVSVFL
jgi:hypothetical protein